MIIRSGSFKRSSNLNHYFVSSPVLSRCHNIIVVLPSFSVIKPFITNCNVFLSFLRGDRRGVCLLCRFLVICRRGYMLYTNDNGEIKTS